MTTDTSTTAGADLSDSNSSEDDSDDHDEVAQLRAENKKLRSRLSSAKSYHKTALKKLKQRLAKAAAAKRKADECAAEARNAKCDK